MYIYIYIYVYIYGEKRNVNYREFSPRIVDKAHFGVRSIVNYGSFFMLVYLLNDRDLHISPSTHKRNINYDIYSLIYYQSTRCHSCVIAYLMSDIILRTTLYTSARGVRIHFFPIPQMSTETPTMCTPIRNVPTYYVYISHPCVSRKTIKIFKL